MSRYIHAGKTSQLQIPRELMGEWQAWRAQYGYSPQVSHAALRLLMHMPGIQRCEAIAKYGVLYESKAADVCGKIG